MIRLAALTLMLLPNLVAAERWQWRDLPPLPRALGGAFAGVIDHHLIVAGGSYWRGAPWIPGSEKIFADVIYSLAPGARQWRTLGHLPSPLGYGASFSEPGVLWLVGGQNAQGARRSILRLNRQGQVVMGGQLPVPLMNMAASKHESLFYLLGGQPNLTSCLRSGDLITWEACDPWPGPGRFFAQATATSDALYLAGGADLKDGQRVFLRDAYRLQKGQWTRLPDLPVVIQAGFAATRNNVPIILSGSDGALAPFEANLAADHPGFSPLIWSFNGTSWLPMGRLPYAPVTATLVDHQGKLVIAGGEDRPAHRSARVLSGELLP